MAENMAAENRAAENAATDDTRQSGSLQPAALPLRVSSSPGFGHTGREAERQIEPRIARMEAEMDAARSRGVLGLLRLRYEAWLEDKMKTPAIAKMQTRQALLEEQRKTAEAEIRLKATVQSGEVGAQRHRIEWNEVNRQRLTGELQSLGMITLSPGPVAMAASSPPPVSTHVTDEQVEAVALRGFLKGVETEEDWLVYRAELGQHLSPYAVEEVGSRLRELWRLNRQAGAGA
jgi:hypothetical protein